MFKRHLKLCQFSAAEVQICLNLKQTGFNEWMGLYRVLNSGFCSIYVCRTQKSNPGNFLGLWKWAGYWASWLQSDASHLVEFYFCLTLIKEDNNELCACYLYKGQRRPRNIYMEVISCLSVPELLHPVKLPFRKQFPRGLMYLRAVVPEILERGDCPGITA